jgi:hypothetical protein
MAWNLAGKKEKKRNGNRSAICTNSKIKNLYTALLANRGGEI